MPEQTRSEHEATQPSRRGFLAGAIAALASFITGAIAVPAIGHIISPALRAETRPLLSLGSVDDFEVGVPEKVEFVYFRSDGWIEEQTSGSAWVVRENETSFAVFDPRCTHLGCPYGWNAEQQHFICPCHNGVFTADGSIVSGPVPRPLDRFEYQVEGGTLFVREVVQRA